MARDDDKESGGSWYNNLVGGAHVAGRAALDLTGKLFHADTTPISDALEGVEQQTLPGGLPAWARKRTPGAAPAEGGDAPQRPWWTGLAATDVAMEVLTPPSRPGRTDGLTFSRDLKRGLMTAWGTRGEFDHTALGEKAGVYFRDGQHFDYFDDPEGSGVKPIQGWPVYASDEAQAPGTTYYVPIAGGPKSGGVYYAAVRFHPEDGAGTRPQKAQGAAPLPPQEPAPPPSMPPAPPPRPWELTVYNDDQEVFTAKGEAESAAANGPHPGVSLVQEGLWEKYAGEGVQPRDLGLPKRLLAWQPDGTIRPAVEEYKSLLNAACDPTNPRAQAVAYGALRSLGITPSQRYSDGG